MKEKRFSILHNKRDSAKVKVSMGFFTVETWHSRIGLGAVGLSGFSLDVPSALC